MIGLTSAGIDTPKLLSSILQQYETLSLRPSFMQKSTIILLGSYWTLLRKLDDSQTCFVEADEEHSDYTRAHNGYYTLKMLGASPS